MVGDGIRNITIIVTVFVVVILEDEKDDDDNMRWWGCDDGYKCLTDERRPTVSRFFKSLTKG